MDQKISKRFYHIDLLECIAILFVVIYHSAFYDTDFLTNGSVLSYIGYYFNTLLSTCVPLFFFANGYLLFSKKFELKKHIYKTLRITALIFVWGFIYISVNTCKKGDVLSVKNIITDFLDWNVDRGIHPLWFLCTIVCIYIIFPALKALYDTNKKAFIAFNVVCIVITVGITFITEIAYAASTVLHSWFGVLNYSKGLLRLNPFSGMEHKGFGIAYFCAGGLCLMFETKILSVPARKRNLLSAVGVVISCTILFGIGIFNSKFIVNEVWDVVYDGYDSVPTFLNVIFIYILCLNYKSKNKLIKTISASTMGVYLLHGFAIGYTAPMLNSIGVPWNIPINIIYATLITLICTGATLAVKKIPVLRQFL